MEPNTDATYAARIIKMARECGFFLTNTDGGRVYWPTGVDGYYTARDLRILADELDQQNTETGDETDATD